MFEMVCAWMNLMNCTENGLSFCSCIHLPESRKGWVSTVFGFMGFILFSEFSHSFPRPTLKQYNPAFTDLFGLVFKFITVDGFEEIIVTNQYFNHQLWVIFYCDDWPENLCAFENFELYIHNSFTIGFSLLLLFFQLHL